jgi:hypothetical protein
LRHGFDEAARKLHVKRLPAIVASALEERFQTDKFGGSHRNGDFAMRGIARVGEKPYQ